MAGRIDAPAKCELRSVIRFLEAEGWFVEDDRCSCFLLDFTMTLRRAILTSGVFLIHGNACPHGAVVTQQFLE
ncbi:hypothetical protein AVEN_83135-1 [Araneus ventricosus]|uniref:Uncharacterized protein n=1 Tax=Araneus ventricosus TaxID=182803 RepID=A0A4Y2AP67_ARAVE|nr:hypothetical protein AVEN_83135-1 [Araneus ventricosus]